MNPRKMQKMVVEVLGEVMGQMVGMQVLLESFDLEQMVGEEFLQSLAYMQKEALGELEKVGLAEPKLWGDGMMCVYDWAAVNMSMMTLPMERELMTMMVEEMVETSDCIVETLMDPEMPGMVQEVVRGAVKGLDMAPGRLDNLTMAAMIMLQNTRTMVGGLRVRDIIRTMKEGEKKIMQVLEEGEWKKLEAMLDMLVMMVGDDKMWLEADKEVKMWTRLAASSLPPTNTWAVPHMVSQVLADLGIEFTFTESDPVFRILTLLENFEEDPAAKAEALVREMFGCAEDFLVQMFTMIASLTEEEGVACMMKTMGLDGATIQMMGQMGSSMAKEMFGKEMAPSVLIRELVNMEVDMQEMMIGSCSRF